MKIGTSLFILVGCFNISGCAGVVSAWKNDPMQAYNVKQASIYTMTGDRRTAIFTDTKSTLKYCAESLPDAVAAYAASSNANLKAEGLKGGAGGEAGFAEGTSVGLLQTFQRTEIAEVSRQLGFNTCLAWSQGAITNEQYHQLLEKIVVGSVEVMKTRAGQELKSPAPATVQIISGPAVKAPAAAPAPAAPAN